MGPPHYAIMAPWYAARSLTKRDKPDMRPDTPFWMYAYRIKDIDGFADQFRALNDDIEELINTIDPQS